MTTANAPAPHSREAGEGLHEPLPRGLELRMRQVVLAHVSSRALAAATPRWCTSAVPTVHELVFACSPGDPDDQGVRTDVLLAMLARTTGSDPLVWITRPGDLATQDDDARLAGRHPRGGRRAGPPRGAGAGRTGTAGATRVPGLARTWRRLRPHP